MFKKNFYVNTWLIRGLTTLSLILIGGSIYAKIDTGGSYSPLMMAGLTTFFIIWLICLGDMLKNRIYNLRFWVVSMFLLPFLAVPLYAIRKPVLTPQDLVLLN